MSVVFLLPMNSSRLSSFCRNCGESVIEEVAFCHNCGTALSDDQVKTNLDHVRMREKSALRSKALSPTSGRIAGAVVIGLLEFLLVIAVFALSFFISINFLPSFSKQGGSLSTYFIVMGTACIAGLTGISFFAQTIRKRYPDKVRLLEKYFLREKASS